jgi:CRP-like cAMP-binding protein
MAPTLKVPLPAGSSDISAQESEQNQILRALPFELYQRLLPQLEVKELPSKYVLWKPHQPIKTVYFPRSCVVSHLVHLNGSVMVEAATVGREGFVGVPLLLGAESTSTETLIQVPGEIAYMSVADLRAVQENDGSLTSLLLRYAQALYEQTAQSVACNIRHTLEERCARWLLMTHDRVGRDTFELTQDYLAAMLGVRRAGVTVAAGMLQRAGFIRYKRGNITVVDRSGLEASACECYEAVRQKYTVQLGSRQS